MKENEHFSKFLGSLPYKIGDTVWALTRFRGKFYAHKGEIIKIKIKVDGCNHMRYRLMSDSLNADVEEQHIYASEEKAKEVARRLNAGW